MYIIIPMQIKLGITSLPTQVSRLSYEDAATFLGTYAGDLISVWKVEAVTETGA